MSTPWRSPACVYMILVAGFVGLTAGLSPATGAGEEVAVKDREAVVAGNTDFALALYAKLARGESGNLFISPYSVSTALAMTYAGARGETARQMAEVLRFTLPPDKLHAAFAAVLAADRPAGDKPGYELHVANALWGQQGDQWLPEFLALTEQHYGAGLRQVDFRNATEQARAAINLWVAEQTREKIKELLKTGDVDPLTALVLTNAIYFKGRWARQFDPKLTEDGPFRISEHVQFKVPLMHQTAEFLHAQIGTPGPGDGPALSLLELPYDGDRLVMTVLLPAEINGLPKVERALSRENLQRWLGDLKPQKVEVTFPRLTLDTRADLAKVLADMGMPDAFMGGKADFSGMNGRRDLFISKVIHQAHGEVNEEGTEAAAATAVVMKRSGPPPAPPAVFSADHPFLFLIRDRQTGSVMFMGRVMKP